MTTRTVYTLNNTEITGAFTDINGIWRPSNWLTNATAQDLTDSGVTVEEVEVVEVTPEEQPQTQFTALEFLERFNETEQLAVVSATLANAQVKLWYDKMLAASFVDITDPRTIGGLDALVAFNLLTETRKDEILQA